MDYAVKLYKKGNMTVSQMCEITNISRASLYRKLSVQGWLKFDPAEIDAVSNFRPC